MDGHSMKRTSVLTAMGLALASGVAACGAKGPPAPAQDGSGGLGASSSGGSASGGATETGSGGTGGGASSGGASNATGGSGTGGQASGGADGSGGGAGTTPPELVTSGPDDYWNTQTVVTETTAAPDLVVNVATTFQRWDGFGGTFNEMGWDALMAVSSEIPRALMLLFDAQDGANFAFGRIPIGASDYAMSWYTLAETANDFEMENFSIERDQEMLIPFIHAAQEVKPDIRFFASPWVVPNWMMDGSKNMKSDPETLEAHALYFAKFVQAYAEEDIVVEAIHPQNEPGYARVHWTQELFIDFIKSYLGPKFVELAVDSEVWCGTMSHPDDGTIATTLAADAEAMQYVKGFGLQWNLQSTVADLAPLAPVMQTEHKCGNYNFETPYWDQSRYDPSKPQNDHLYGEESWQLIRDWIVAGVNSYSAWNMVLDTVGKSLDGWPQNALLVVDRSAQTLIVTPAYHVFRHFSQYIAPGATRVEITGSSDSLAFLNPDGSIVTEVYNSEDGPKVVIAQVGGRTLQFDVPGHGWATLRVAP